MTYIYRYFLNNLTYLYKNEFFLILQKNKIEGGRKIKMGDVTMKDLSFITSFSAVDIHRNLKDYKYNRSYIINVSSRMCARI